jgi:hypothetical protein
MKPDKEAKKSGLKDYYEAFIKPKFYLIKAAKRIRPGVPE